MTSLDARWWRSAVFYHVYLRSFADSNGDGVGDLPGLTQRIDYLSELGVDALWLSPIHPSPNRDFGYDVSDYRGVDPTLGTAADLRRLVEDLHARGMRLVLDLVPNHTSSEHPWFVDARSSRRAAHRPYYVWRDPAPGGGPPNNWVTVFGGPSWTLDELTGQYWLHSFLPDQPDLDLRNPEVVRELRDIMRYWLDRGVDGFRIDSVQQLAKDPALRSNPGDPDYAVDPRDPDHEAYRTQRHVHDTLHRDLPQILGELRRALDGYGDRVLIGEIGTFDLGELAGLVGDGSGCDLGIDFHLTHTRSLRELRDAVEAQYDALQGGAWPTLVLSNHDGPRAASRLSEGAGGGDAIVRAAAAVLLLARGTPLIYYGEEIGRRDVQIPDADLRDALGIRARRMGATRGPAGFGRDPSRAPMPWEEGAAGGFTQGEPWLPVGDTRLNVATQRRDPTSLWHWHRRLLALRRESAALALGAYARLAAPPGCWLFERGGGAERMQAAAGAKRLRAVIELDGVPTKLDVRAGTVRLGTHRTEGVRHTGGSLRLSPHEVLVLDP